MIDINKLRVASPCSVGWKTMSGDERVRHCESCKLNVYNIAGMTNAEVQQLVSNREGRLCIRLFRRTDGTVLTKDCPVGFRAYQKRIARFASATLAAILGLLGVSFGQKDDKKGIDASKIKIERTVVEIANSKGKLSGTIFDEAGAVIAGATVELTFKKGETFQTISKISNDYGVYNISYLEPGDNYTVVIQSPGFKSKKVHSLKIGVNESLKLDVVLSVGGETVTVGIFAEEPLIDMGSSSITTTITGRQLERRPF